MRRPGRSGAVRGKSIKTTVSNPAVACPQDKVNRQFAVDWPNALRGGGCDYAFVSTWAGFLFAAFVIDVYAQRIVAWRVSASLRAAFVLDALEQALHARQPAQGAADPPQ